MSAPDDPYRRELLTALRMRDVHPDRIGEALAEVDSHVAESHEDPVEAFGPAGTYAESFPSRDADRPPLERAVRGSFRAAAGAVVGLVGVTGAVGVAIGDDTALGLPPVVPLVAGILLAVAGAVALTRRAGVVRDPRTRAAADPDIRLLAPILVVAYVGLLAVAAGLAVLTN